MTNDQLIKILRSIIDHHFPHIISETVYISNDRLMAYDFYTYISIPYKSGGIKACLRINDLDDAFKKIKQPQFSTGDRFQVHITGSRIRLKVYGYDPEEYLTLPIDRKISFTQIAEWTAKEIGYLKKALLFVRKERWNKDEWNKDESKDQTLKLAMTGVFAGPHIVALDRYRMYRQPLTPAIEPSFIIPAKTAKLLTSLPGATWKLFYGIQEIQQHGTGEKSKTSSAAHVYLISKKGIIVGFKPVNAPYPNYQAAIPEGECQLTIKVSSAILKLEVAKAILHGNPYTFSVVFRISNTLQVSARYIDESTEYKNEVTASCRFTKPGDHNEFTIRFDGEYLISILEQVVGEVTFKFWTPTSLVTINNKYFISPLMLLA